MAELPLWEASQRLDPCGVPVSPSSQGHTQDLVLVRIEKHLLWPFSWPDRPHRQVKSSAIS